jgi:hypothetical protein
MNTLTRPFGYAVAHFGRLTLTSRDYAQVAPECECDDGEAFFLPDPIQRRRLLREHGHDAADLVSRWRYEAEVAAAEQREAYAEMVADYHNSRGVRM